MNTNKFRLIGAFAVFNMLIAFGSTKVIVFLLGEDSYGQLIYGLSISALIITLVAEGEDILLLNATSLKSYERIERYTSSFVRRLIMLSVVLACVLPIIGKSYTLWLLLIILLDSFRSLASPSIGDAEGMQEANAVLAAIENLIRLSSIFILCTLLGSQSERFAKLSLSFSLACFSYLTAFFFFFRKLIIFKSVRHLLFDISSIKQEVRCLVTNLPISLSSFAYLGFGLFYKFLSGFYGEFNNTARFSIAWAVTSPAIALVELYVRNRTSSFNLSILHASYPEMLQQYSSRSTLIAFSFFLIGAPILYIFITSQSIYEAFPFVLSANIYMLLALFSRIRRRQVLFVDPSLGRVLLQDLLIGSIIAVTLTYCSLHFHLEYKYAFLPLLVGHGVTLFLQNKLWQRTKAN